MHLKKVKGILSSSNGMNLYRGCTHGCIYCDSRSKCYHMEHAFEDVEEDIKKQTYNPFKEKFKDEHFQEDCFHLLEMMISNSSFYFEKLPLIENVELLRNIIYSGIWTKFELIKKKRMEEKS